MLYVKEDSMVQINSINSSYKFVYAEYIPLEFLCGGLISACLTFINIICIFVTAIIILKASLIYLNGFNLLHFFSNDQNLLNFCNVL